VNNTLPAFSSSSRHPPEPDLMRMRADMSYTPCRIAELGFSMEAGCWTYKKLRTDKDSPNYFTTVATTLLELAEGVGEEELHYRMMLDNPSQDDWSKQVGRMQVAAVQWRRRKRGVENGNK